MIAHGVLEPRIKADRITLDIALCEEARTTRDHEQTRLHVVAEIRPGKQYIRISKENFMGDLRLRLDRLERKNRYLTGAVVTLAISLVLLLIIAWKPPDGAVETQRLTIRDEDGNLVMLLGKGDNGQRGLFLKQKEVTLLSATTDEKGIPRIICRGGEGDFGQVLLEVNPEAGAFVSLRPPGKDRESIGLATGKLGSRVQVTDESGLGTVLIKAKADMASLSISGREEGILLESTNSEGSEIRLSDALKQTRFLIQVPAHSEPAVSLKNADGSVKWEAGK